MTLPGDTRQILCQIVVSDYRSHSIHIRLFRQSRFRAIIPKVLIANGAERKDGRRISVWIYIIMFILQQKKKKRYRQSDRNQNCNRLGATSETDSRSDYRIGYVLLSVQTNIWYEHLPKQIDGMLTQASKPIAF